MNSKRDFVELSIGKPWEKFDSLIEGTKYRLDIEKFNEGKLMATEIMLVQTGIMVYGREAPRVRSIKIRCACRRFQEVQISIVIGESQIKTPTVTLKYSMAEIKKLFSSIFYKKHVKRFIWIN